MSREMKSGSTEAYRVVLDRTLDDGSFMPEVTFGPFATKSAAKGIRSREIGLWMHWDYRYDRNTKRTAKGRIQRTNSEWVDIDE